MKTNFKGFASISIIFMLAGALLVGGGIWYWQKNKVVNNNSVANNQQATSTIKEMNQGPVSTWLTYKNDKYGFEFQYPSELNLSENIRNYTLNKGATNENPYQSININLSSNGKRKAWMQIEIVIANQTLDKAVSDIIDTVATNAEMGTPIYFDLRAVATSSIVVGGFAAEKIILNSSVTEGVAVKDNANLYIITQYGLNNFDRIISTFKFTNKGTIDLRLQPHRTTLPIESGISGASGVTFGSKEVIVRYESATSTMAILNITVAPVSKTMKFELNKEIILAGFGFTVTSIKPSSVLSNGTEVLVDIVEKN